eukprot:3600632-Pyramimonas_sp.AAC.1
MARPTHIIVARTLRRVIFPIGRLAKGWESLAADLATDRARLIPDRAPRDLGRSLSAGGDARAR